MSRPGRFRLRRFCDRCLRARIVGWRVSRTAHAGFVLDALEQALHDRRPVHHRRTSYTVADRGHQIVSIKYTERLTEAGVEPSTGEHSATLTTMLSPKRSTVSPTRPRSSIARAVAELRSRRSRDTGVGRLVQQSPPAGAHGNIPAAGGRRKPYYAMLAEPALWPRNSNETASGKPRHHISSISFSKCRAVWALERPTHSRTPAAGGRRESFNFPFGTNW